MREKYYRSIVIVILMVTGCLAVWGKDGLSFKVEVRQYGEGIESRDTNTVTWWQNRWMDDSADGAVIFDLQNSRLYLLDRRNQLWTGGELQPTLDEMQRATVNLAKKVRQNYGISRKDRIDDVKNPFAEQVKLVFVNQEKVDGKLCRHYRIMYRDELKEEIWIATEYMPGNYLDLKRFLPALERYSRIMDIFSRELTKGDKYLLESAIQDKLMTLFTSGLELRSREYTNGKLLYEKVVTDIKTWKGSEEQFAPPSGYKKIPYSQYLENGIPTVREIFDPDNLERH